jgi:DNA repair photolyase
MAPPVVQPLEVASALNRVRGMPFKWSLNPYRGCAHGCHYCFARSTHTFFELDAGSDFSSVLFAKLNLPEALERDLSRRGWRRELVAIGTATDPYQPIEGRYRLTRTALRLLARYRTPASIVTKGSMLVRDLDVLGELADVAGVTVCHSIPTVDEAIWRRTEPGTPPPRQRLRAMRRLREAGIRAGVLMAPLLPGLSAEPGAMAATARAAAEHGAAFVSAVVLHLGPGVREHFQTFLTREYPELALDYAQLYAGKYAPRAYQSGVHARLLRLRRELGLGERELNVRVPPQAPAQLSLGL